MIGTSHLSAAFTAKNDGMQKQVIDFWFRLKNVYSYIGFCFSLHMAVS